MDDQQLQRIRDHARSAREHAGDVLALVGAFHDLRHQIDTLEAQVETLTALINNPPDVALCGRARLGGYHPAGAAALDDLYGRVEVVSGFVDWTHRFGSDLDRQLVNEGRRVLYAWEPHGLRFADVTAGDHDAYLTDVAAAAVTVTGDLYVRPWPEMNANWSDWQPTANGHKPDGGTPTEFVAAWRYLADFLRTRGAGNLRLVFSADASDHADNTPIPAIWPGSEYVDVLGIDGYNWGENPATGDTWRTFDSIFANMYQILTGLHGGAPVWITEVGCKEPAVDDGAPVDPDHSKARWVADMLASTAFPRVEVVAWFDVTKERDWRLDSDPAAVEAFAGCLTRR